MKTGPAYPAAFGNTADANTCSMCGFFSVHIAGGGLCHFTGEENNCADKAMECAGFHAGKWQELWETKGKNHEVNKCNDRIQPAVKRNRSRGSP